MKPKINLSPNSSFDYRLPIIKQTSGYNYASNSKLRIPKEFRLNVRNKSIHNFPTSELTITKIYENSLEFVKKKPCHKKKLLMLSQSFYDKKFTKQLVQAKNIVRPVFHQAKDEKICGWDID